MSTAKRASVRLGASLLVVIVILIALTALLPRAYADEPIRSGASGANPPPGNPPSTPLTRAATTNRLYLPMVLKGGPASGGPTSTPIPTPGSGGGISSFFLRWVINGEARATDGPSVAVDTSGGVHIAYGAYTADASGKRPAYYVYCASNCGNPANFSAPVALGGKVDHVNLALDAGGHPRILWMGIDPTAQKLQAYYYDTCETACTNAASWTLTRVLGTDSGLAHDSRIFALDPQGRPRFVFYEDWCDGNCVVNKGTFFLYCDTGCTAPGGWFKNKLSDQELSFPSLAITSTGLPRLAVSYLDMSVDPAWPSVLYIECDTYCANATVGAAFDGKTCRLCNEPGGYFRLKLDSSGHPRLALYTGSLDAGSTLQANRLYYLYCNTSCGNASSNDWTGYALNLPVGVGTYVDLAIGPQNRPRLAFEKVSEGLVYAWCTANCEAGSPAWQTILADSSATLDATEPVPPIPPCTVAGWFTGKRASLAFDSSGNPRIAYDAEHWQGLDPVTNPPGSPGCPGFRQDQINARFTILNQP